MATFACISWQIMHTNEKKNMALRQPKRISVEHFDEPIQGEKHMKVGRSLSL